MVVDVFRGVATAFAANDVVDNDETSSIPMAEEKRNAEEEEEKKK